MDTQTIVKNDSYYKNKKFKYKMFGNRAKFDGIPGDFSYTVQGAFNKLYYAISNDNGIGCKYLECIGHIPNSTWPGQPNNIHDEMISDRIEMFIENGGIEKALAEIKRKESQGIKS